MRKILATVLAIAIAIPAAFAGQDNGDLHGLSPAGNWVPLNTDSSGNLKVSGGGGSATPSGTNGDVQIADLTGAALSSDPTFFRHDAAAHQTTDGSENLTNGEERTLYSTYGVYMDGNDAALAGVMRFGSIGNTNNESLDWDYETTSNKVGVSSASGVTDINITPIVQAGGFKSSDGTAGMTGSCGAATTATIKNGLVTACA